MSRHGIMALAALQLGIASWPLTARGQSVFAEDFERPAIGDLLGPQWTYHLRPGGTGSLTGAAARRGSQGYRADAKSAAEFRRVELGAGSAPLRADVSLRFFVRVDGLEGTDVAFIAASDGAASGQTQLNLSLDGELRLATALKVQGSGNDRVRFVGPRLARQRWTLVDLWVTGAGTSAACVRTAVDGAPVGERCGVDLSGFLLGKLGLGLTYVVPFSVAGVADFDDLVFGSTPVAARLVLSTETDAMRGGGCVPVRAELRGSFTEVPLPAPFDEIVPLSGAFDTFADAACLEPSAGLRLVAGQASGIVFIAPRRNGTLPLGARPLSVVLAAEPTLEVTGVPEVAGPEPVMTCGCRAASWPLAAATVLVLRARRRARR
ncbi:MAG: hypothetical protein SFW67_28105 [Myxococcaceae bacterium]|nr:hypothetical protein [Myxococcaceae bacterium]